MSISRVYPNVVYLAALVAVASIVYSLFAPTGLEKGAFIFATVVAPGLIATAGVFAKRASGTGPAFSFNVAVLTTLALLVLVALLVGLDVTVFTDMVAEGVSSAIAGGLIGLITTYAGTDHE